MILVSISFLSSIPPKHLWKISIILKSVRRLMEIASDRQNVRVNINGMYVKERIPSEE